MRRKRSAPLFSFAFLDVFACALGSLIFILAACALRGQGLTRDAARTMSGSIEALRERVDDLQQLHDEVEAERDAHAWQRDGLTAQLEVAQAELAKADARLESARARNARANAEAQGEGWTWLRLPGEVAGRAPLYLECKQDRVLQQPTGLSEATPALRDPSSETRALLTRVRSDPARYVVIVVRESGLSAYAHLTDLCRELDVTFAREPFPDSVHVEGWR